MNSPPRRTIYPGKKKEFAPASDARDLRKKKASAVGANIISDFFSKIYQILQTLLFFSAAGAGIQAAYQAYFYASERVWKKFSALDALQRMDMAPVDPKWTNTLDLVSLGVAGMISVFALMVVAQVFIKKSSA